LRSSLVTGAVAWAAPGLKLLGSGIWPPRSPRTSASFELEEVAISELQDAQRTGRLTAHAIAEAYLERIEAIDRHGPALSSVIEINPEALAIADGLDQERQVRGPRGPLHGIPIFLKDNIDTADKMATTAGSLALVESHPSRDAILVHRLRQAGAVILGKTNLSEWANFRSSHSISGWSARGGFTRNPYALDRNPCGSSSGSAVAISANLAAVAVGTETDGSIVCPSSANSLVGIKPTLGLVSRAGIIPIAHSQDTAGPLARTVRDAAILLGVLSGTDPDDPVSRAGPGSGPIDYTRFLEPDGLQGRRIGVARNFFGFNEEVDRLMEACLGTIKQQGATLVDPAVLPNAEKLEAPEREVMLYEFKADLNAYLSKLSSDVPVRSLKDVIEFNERNRGKEMPYFGQDLFLKAEAKGPLTSPLYRKALETGRRLSRSEGIDAVMLKYRLDAMIAPTGGPCWLTDLLNGDHFSGGFSAQAAVAGYPHITLPAGYIHGLPVGISFFGKAHSEPTLIKLAYAFEQATKVRRPPRFLPTADLSASVKVANMEKGWD
jgi:amidase